jgi:tRNA A-37 threonylcarbamoyl transferase component Bud32/DNA-binding NarL/FixJ family response regulator
MSGAAIRLGSGKGREGREDFQVMVDRLLVIDDAKDVQDLITYCARRNWPDADVDWYDPVARGRPDADFDWSGYDFVFLDAHFGLTDDDGLSWLREFSRDGKLPPVIVLTDQVSEESSAIARKLGAKYYIDKHDLSPRLLASAVEAILENRAWISPGENGDLEDDSDSEMIELEDLDSVIDAELPALDLELYDDEGSEPIVEMADVFDPAAGETNLEELGEPLQALPFNVDVPGFRLKRILSSGASSLVLLAERKKDDRLAVLKVISTDVQDDKKVLKRFMREQRMLSKLRHPNIVKIYSGGVTEDSAYIAMEYFPGGDLRKRIDAGIPEGKALEYFRGVAKGLGAAHEVGIIHRDIKPANILIRKDDTVAIADFGISKSLGASTAITVVGFVMGTPFYISPEQIDGEPATACSDLYSLGVILFELLTGERPYPQTRLPALLRAHAEDPLPRLPVEHEHMQFVLDGLMAKKPKERFQSVAELLIALGPE